MTEKRVLEITLDAEIAEQLERCAQQRGVAAAEMARAYVEDWVDADTHPFSRRSIYREHTMTLEERLGQSRPGPVS